MYNETQRDQLLNKSKLWTKHYYDDNVRESMRTMGIPIRWIGHTTLQYINHLIHIKMCTHI